MVKTNQREMGIGNDKISAVCLFVLLWCLKKKKKKEKLQFFNCQKNFLELLLKEEKYAIHKLESELFIIRDIARL